MDYKQGRVGRFFVINFADGDDLLDGIKRVALDEEIRYGWFVLLGGLRQAGIVTGPKEPVIPPIPVWKEISDDAREIMGIGTVMSNGEEPTIHLHTAVGKADEVNVGCIRRDAHAYLIVECLLIELDGVNIRRRLDPESGLCLASFD